MRDQLVDLIADSMMEDIKAVLNELGYGDWVVYDGQNNAYTVEIVKQSLSSGDMLVKVFGPGDDEDDPDYSERQFKIKVDISVTPSNTRYV